MGIDTYQVVDDPMTARFGFLFPGQGAQYVGMGKDLYSHYPLAKKTFDDADRILGFSLSNICFNGPEEELTRTLRAQPAIYVTSLTALNVLREKIPDLKPAFSAGLSLGEFTALAAAGSISFESGIRLVQLRAQAMEDCAKANPGTMASILGLAPEACEKAAREAGCEVANLNSPDQIVLSGRIDAVEKACRLAEEAGAKKAIMLRVGGAFHSSLMRGAKDALETVLSQTDIRDPQCPFVSNAAGTLIADAKSIRRLLAEQLVSPVQWIKTMAIAAAQNIPTFIEIGPGKVLKGLAKKSQPTLKIEPCGSKDDIEKLEQDLKLSQTS